MIAINNSFPEIKTLGLCHSVQGTAEMLADDLGEKIEDIDYVCAGINHMAFYQKFQKNLIMKICILG
jgi:alpha-galactosidase